MASSLLTELYKQLQITPKIISPYNHGSLKTERHIQSLSNMLTKYLTGTGDQWPTYLAPIVFAHNSFVNQNIGLSPFELVFGRKPKGVGVFEIKPLHEITQTYQEYHKSLLARFNKISQMVLDKQIEKQQTQNLERPNLGYTTGDLVYLISPNTSYLMTDKKKFRGHYIGPLVVAEVLDIHHYLLMDLDGKLLNGVYHVMRLKTATIRTSHGNATKLSEINKLSK